MSAGVLKKIKFDLGPKQGAVLGPANWFLEVKDQRGYQEMNCSCS